VLAGYWLLGRQRRADFRLLPLIVLVTFSIG
jgi:hypothetical protein